MVNFTVTAQITDADQLVKPDMTAAVNIVTYTANNVVLIPNRAIRTINGRQVVYILRNGAAVPVPVTVSQQGDTDSELSSNNIRVGDLLVTNPPSTVATPAAGGGFFLGGGGGRVPAGGGGGPVKSRTRRIRGDKPWLIWSFE